jgi:hypothetical protein
MNNEQAALNVGLFVFFSAQARKKVYRSLIFSALLECFCVMAKMASPQVEKKKDR